MCAILCVCVCVGGDLSRMNSRKNQLTSQSSTRGQSSTGVSASVFIKLGGKASTKAQPELHVDAALLLPLLSV